MAVVQHFPQTPSTQKVHGAENNFLARGEWQLQDIICTVLCSAAASALTGFLGLWQCVHVPVQLRQTGLPGEEGDVNGS